MCARALVARGPEGIDAKRSPAGALVVLGAGLAIVAGGLVVALVDNDIDPERMRASIPQLMPPDSGVLGITESGGDEKDRRDGAERSGKLQDGDGDGDGGDGDGNDGEGDGDGDRARSAVTVDDRRPKDVGDLASTPPLLPPIGSDEPDSGAPVPPLDGAPGMPPPLVPVADIGGDSSGGDDSDDRDDDGDRGDSRDGEHTVVLAPEGGERRALLAREGVERLALAIDEEDILAIASSAAAELARVEPGVPVGVFEACDLPGYEDGELIAFAGRFDAERKAEELLDRLRDLDFGEDVLLDVLFVPEDKADRCPGSELVDDGDGAALVDDGRRVASGDGGDGDDLGDDLPDLTPGGPELKDEEPAPNADESTPPDDVEPDLPGPDLPR